MKLSISRYWLAAGLLALSIGPARGADEPQAKHFFEMSDKEIDQAVRAIHAQYPALPDRIAKVSEYFLTTPYRLGPLGEGPWGQFSRNPLISFKEVDCTTFVEETMALSLERKLNHAIRTLQKIRYKDGKIYYETRNHFPEADWIPNNIAAGYIRDITREIGGEYTATASKVIKKREWYQIKTIKDLEGFEEAPKKEQRDRLKRMHELGRQFEDRRVSIDYVPISILPQVKDKIPSGAIVNVVREDKKGFPVLVGHQAFIIDKNGQLYVRFASSSGRVEFAPGAGLRRLDAPQGQEQTRLGKVEDVPLLEYFYRFFDSSWRVLGLNFNEVRDPRRKH